MVGQCHRGNQHEFDAAPGRGVGWEGLACSGPWGHEESDTTKRLNKQTIPLKQLPYPVFAQPGVGGGIPQSENTNMNKGTN